MFAAATIPNPTAPAANLASNDGSAHAEPIARDRRGLCGDDHAPSALFQTIKQEA